MTENNDLVLPDHAIVGLACRLGALKALEFKEFAESLPELTRPQRMMLLRGWLAMMCLPGDAELEAQDVRNCLSALRTAWITLNKANKK